MSTLLSVHSAFVPPALIPMPGYVTWKEGNFTLSNQTTLAAPKSQDDLAQQFQSWVKPGTGLELPISSRAKASSISLSLNSGLTQLGPEGYRLSVNSRGVKVTAAGRAGLFYGLQTLRQLLPVHTFGSVASSEAISIPCVEIEDHPRFAWRGAMIDPARHFIPKAAVLQFIDVIALHKLNHLHIHLTDDQGWRIEIKKYPGLTDQGSIRKAPAIGDGTAHAGFYTQADLRQIVAYAASRFITVIPEIEMPGHAGAALAAYPQYGNTGKILEVKPDWGVHGDIFNPSMETIHFLQDVLTEVMEIFPSKFIHIGGDEVPKEQWIANPAAQAQMKQLGLKNPDELQSWIIKQMDTFLANHHRRLVGWDEILEGGLAPGATVMSWRGISGGIKAAQSGHDVVMAPTDNTYLDYYQSQDTAKEPAAIGGFLPLEKVYSYEPIPSELTPEQAKHVMGVQGQLWAEYISTPSHLQYMAFPRLCAISEVGWSQPAARGWDSFVIRLNRHLPRLAAMGINYRRLDANLVR